MYALSDSAVFFEKSIVGLEDWKRKQLSNAVRRLVDRSRGPYAFIGSDGLQSNHFLIIIGMTPNDPVLKYEAAIVSPYKSLRLLCRFIKEQY
jgi:hypothetical protein